MDNEQLDRIEQKLDYLIELLSNLPDDDQEQEPSYYGERDQTKPL